MADEFRFTEYRTVAISEPLRQGDVLERVSDDANSWNRNLLVITADCDFANDKHQGRVTCVPLLTKDEYLLSLILPKIREATLVKLTERANALLEKMKAVSISAQRLRDWPKEQSTEEILNLLPVSNESKSELGRIFDNIRDLAVESATLHEAVKKIVSAQLIISSGKKEISIRKDISSRLQSAFKQPPGDALFLSALADGYDHGYFVYLRHLEQVWEPEIALGPSRIGTKYRRLSRIQETYTHALAQRFALVFMSIGLPDDYEEMRNLHSEMLAQEMK
jgi:uncharacterized protein YdaT